MKSLTLSHDIFRRPSTLLLPLGLLLVAALPVQAISSFSETFSTAVLKTSRWSLTEEGGRLASSSGKLLYSVVKTGDDSASHIMLRGIEPKYNENWEVTVDAVNSTRLDTWTWIGVAVLNAADEEDAVGLELSSGSNMTEIFSDFSSDGKEAADVDKTISSNRVSLRVTFSSATKVLSLWYRTSPTGAWKKHATFSTNNKAGSNRRGNWGMKPTSKFKVALYGGSEGSAVPAGQMSLDNFKIRNIK